MSQKVARIVVQNSAAATARAWDTIGQDGGGWWSGGVVEYEVCVERWRGGSEMTTSERPVSHEGANLQLKKHMKMFSGVERLEGYSSVPPVPVTTRMAHVREAT
jgi:hypothetical protein